MKIKSEHWLDENENPAGGSTFGDGFVISWQNGPLGRGNERKEANGAFVEHIIMAAIDRMEFYQDSKFACSTNDDTLMHLKCALSSQQSRTQNRETRGVEGTHKK